MRSLTTPPAPPATQGAPTAAQRLLELKLGEPLSGWVAERRNGRPVWSWQQLADELHDRTEVRVSREWLRSRFGEVAA